MKIKVSASELKGEIVVPSSKSAGQRALALSLLHHGRTRLKNLGNSEDEMAALQVIRDMGADIIHDKDGSLLITSAFGSKKHPRIHCGESGLGFRMFAPIVALQDGETELTGKGSLLSRPMNFFDEIFPKLGVGIRSNNGHLPLFINGPLKPKNITIDGSLSSQFLTGLLIAFAYSAKEQANITVNDLVSKPYIDLTLKMLEEFGYRVTNRDYREFIIHPKTNSLEQENIAFEYTVEADWSSASFLIVSAAINGSLKIRGLDMFSAQADKAILEILSSAQIHASIREEELMIRKSEIQPFHFDATECPDLFPPLVALAAFANGSSVIKGINRLTHKESNRALTLQEEFSKMGVQLTLQDDLMIIKGGNANGSTEL